jgi:hypothetical protein
MRAQLPIVLDLLAVSPGYADDRIFAFRAGQTPTFAPLPRRT